MRIVALAVASALEGQQVDDRAAIPRGTIAINSSAVDALSFWRSPTMVPMPALPTSCRQALSGRIVLRLPIMLQFALRVTASRYKEQALSPSAEAATTARRHCFHNRAISRAATRHAPTDISPA